MNIVSELKAIIAQIESDQIEGEGGAIEKFRTYLRQLLSENYGQYDPDKWSVRWRKVVYDFGKVFRKNNANSFLMVLDDVSGMVSEARDKEVLDFIESEVRLNHFPLSQDGFKEYLLQLLNKYENNPEFKITYCNVLIADGKLPEAIAQSDLAIKIEPSNGVFVERKINFEKDYMRQLISDSKPKQALEYLEKMQKHSYYNENYVYNNFLLTERYRIQDHISWSEKVKGLSDEIAKQTEKERRRLVEVIGIFAAIISFVVIVTDIAINQNFSLSEMLVLMTGMAFVLLIFAFAMSAIFQTKEQLKSLPKIAMPVLLIVALFLLIFISSQGCFSNHENDNNPENAESQTQGVAAQEEDIDVNVEQKTHAKGEGYEAASIDE